MHVYVCVCILLEVKDSILLVLEAAIYTTWELLELLLATRPCVCQEEKAEVEASVAFVVLRLDHILLLVLVFNKHILGATEIFQFVFLAFGLLEF